MDTSTSLMVATGFRDAQRDEHGAGGYRRQRSRQVDVCGSCLLSLSAVKRSSLHVRCNDHPLRSLTIECLLVEKGATLVQCRAKSGAQCEKLEV